MLWNGTFFSSVNPFLTSNWSSDRWPWPRSGTALAFHRWRNWGSGSVNHLPRNTASWKRVWNKRRASWSSYAISVVSTEESLSWLSWTLHSPEVAPPSPPSYLGPLHPHNHPVSWKNSASGPPFFVALSPTSTDISPAFSLYPKWHCFTSSIDRPSSLNVPFFSPFSASRPFVWCCCLQDGCFPSAVVCLTKLRLGPWPSSPGQELRNRAAPYTFFLPCAQPSFSDKIAF